MNKYIKKYIPSLIAAVVAVAFSSVSAVSVQFIKGELLDNALTFDFSVTIHAAIILVLIISLEIIFFGIYGKSSNIFSTKCVSGLRKDYFNSILSLEYSDFRENTISDYVAKYTKSIDLVETSYFKTIPVMAELLSKITFVSIGLLILDWRLAIITLLLLSTPIFIPKLIEKKLNNAQKSVLLAFESNISQFTEWLNGFELIRNYLLKHKILVKYESNLKDTYQADLYNKNIRNTSRILMMCISYFSHFLIIAIAAIFVAQREFSAGDFFVAVGMIDQLSYPLISLSGYIQSLVSIKEINKELMDNISANTNPSRKQELYEHFNESIKFSDVSFSYGSNEILKKFKYEIPSKSKTLIIGTSGIGKTTILNLIMGYYETIEGSLTIDNIPIEELNTYPLMSIIRQDTFLFNDTLRNNLCLYSDIQEEKMMQVLNAVHLGYLSDKLDDNIGENGSKLSGGERKRVAIARALLQQREILLIDEPLANLDKENVNAIEDTILSIEGKTIILVSHQFSSNKLSRFDNILDFDSVGHHEL